jgi:hypothetical protein
MHFPTVILEQRLFWGLVKGHGCFLCLLNLPYDYLHISTRLWHERMVYGIAMAIYRELIGHLNLQVNSTMHGIADILWTPSTCI